MIKYSSFSIEDTKNIAKNLLQHLDHKRRIIILEGDLGTGKTQFVKGIASALHINKNIYSPTFILMNIYKIPKNNKFKQLVHIDAYRLNSEQELLDIGIDNYLTDSNSLILIEWGNKVEKIFKNLNPIVVKLNYGDVADERIITIMR